MSDSQNLSQSGALPAEDKERVNRIAADIMEPALRKAIGEAVAEAPEMEVISAIANAYAALLIETLGAKPAAGLMRAHADHIDSLEEKLATGGKH
jgi:hypothetical protein